MNGDLEYRAEKHKEGETIVLGLFAGGKRIGCVWRTTAVGDLFNWSHHGGASGSGFGSEGYSLKQAMRDLVSAARLTTQQGDDA